MKKKKTILLDYVSQTFAFYNESFILFRHRLIGYFQTTLHKLETADENENIYNVSVVECYYS